MKFFTLDLRFQTEGLMKTEFLFTSKKPVNLFTKSRIPGALKPREFVNCVYFLCPAGRSGQSPDPLRSLYICR